MDADCLISKHLPHCAEKGKTVFGNLCTLQRQASHFLSVLQASRHPTAPPVASAAALQDEHTAEEKTAKQMAERIIQTHKYGTLSLMTLCQICSLVMGQHSHTGLWNLHLHLACM